MKERFFLGMLLSACLALLVSCGPVPTAVPQASPTPTAAGRDMVSPAPWKVDGLISEREYPHKIEVAGMEFHWLNDDSHLYAAMSAETSGWVSVGFDPEDRMKGANYVLGYVKDGEVFIQDMFGVKPIGPGSHPPDEELGGANDILEYAGREAGGLTVIEFKTPLDSGDQYDKPLRSGGSYDLIVAIGPRDDFASRHVSRGYGQITID